MLGADVADPPYRPSIDLEALFPGSIRSIRADLLHPLPAGFGGRTPLRGFIGKDRKPGLFHTKIVGDSDRPYPTPTARSERTHRTLDGWRAVACAPEPWFSQIGDKGEPEMGQEAEILTRSEQPRNPSGFQRLQLGSPCEYLTPLGTRPAPTPASDSTLVRFKRLRPRQAHLAPWPAVASQQSEPPHRVAPYTRPRSAVPRWSIRSPPVSSIGRLRSFTGTTLFPAGPTLYQ